MLLILDIGNTSITLGIYDGPDFVKELRLPSDKDMLQSEYEEIIDSLLKNFLITGCVIGSVVEELTQKVADAVRTLYSLEPLIVSNLVDTGVKICTDYPSQVGADRIANAVAVKDRYKLPVIVIDFGTATSFDVVNSKGEFIGGVIALGLNTQMKSLNKFTSKLPKTEVAISNKAIGSNTTDAILSGVIRGTACMIDGMVKQCEQELGEKATIVATGGYSGLIANYLSRPFDYINPTLTIDGLRLIYLKNANKNADRVISSVSKG